jgi:hypothetical protein
MDFPSNASEDFIQEAYDPTITYPDPWSHHPGHHLGNRAVQTEGLVLDLLQAFQRVVPFLDFLQAFQRVVPFLDFLVVLDYQMLADLGLQGSVCDWVAT